MTVQSSSSHINKDTVYCSCILLSSVVWFSIKSAEGRRHASYDRCQRFAGFLEYTAALSTQQEGQLEKTEGEQEKQMEMSEEEQEKQLKMLEEEQQKQLEMYGAMTSGLGSR